MPMTPDHMSRLATPSATLRRKRKHRAAVLSWEIAPAAIDPILDHHPIEKVRTTLWRARRAVTDAALAVAGSYARAQ
jgi:hypothetical protein